MDLSLKRMLGMDGGDKRQYRVVDGEVTREEFEYGQMLDAVLFGKDGYVETLGPTWDMIHDPRFTVIEDAFILNRRAVLGGDAGVGKQYISSDGTFTSSVADLEQYSETLGEGRYFYYVLKHPNKECPVRKWHFRIFSDADKAAAPVASADLTCNCTDTELQDSCLPHNLKDADDSYVWYLIKQECPNYFTQDGTPNGVAKRLFDIFRADLLGLIADYAVVPMSDVFVSLDTGDVFSQQEQEMLGSTPHVFLEVDILEKALTQRAVLRASAAKILMKIGFTEILEAEFGEDFELTEYERDHVLRLVYNPMMNTGGLSVVSTLQVDPSANWFIYLRHIKDSLLSYLRGIKATGWTVSERQHNQLALASSKAHDTFDRLIHGELKPINQYTEPEVDINLDAHAEIMQSLLKNPLKQELFLMYVEAERRTGDDNEDNTDRLNMRKLFSILTPLFTDADYPVGEDEYANYAAQAEELGLFNTPNVVEVDEEYHG
jgi:hypothetical protein